MDPNLDDHITNLVKSLPDERPNNVPPKFKVVRRSVVQEEGGDPNDVERWANGIGGGRVPLFDPILGGRAEFRPKDGKVGIAVPWAALGEESTASEVSP